MELKNYRAPRVLRAHILLAALFLGPLLIAAAALHIADDLTMEAELKTLRPIVQASRLPQSRPHPHRAVCRHNGVRGTYLASRADDGDWVVTCRRDILRPEAQKS